MATFQNIQCNIIVKYDRVYIYMAGRPMIPTHLEGHLLLFVPEACPIQGHEVLDDPLEEEVQVKQGPPDTVLHQILPPSGVQQPKPDTATHQPTK